MNSSSLEILGNLVFFLALNGLLWFKFCKKLNVYAQKIGRNPTLSMLVAYSPMVIFPAIIGLVAAVVNSYFENNEVLYIIVLIVLFFLLFGSYLISLFWFGGITTTEQVRELNK